MTTLADKAILSGADNRPPMLEKDIQHGRMILESVENGPLFWPTVEENRVTRPKKYSELSATEAIQADCDVKATNIILQGLPPEISGRSMRILAKSQTVIYCTHERMIPEPGDPNCEVPLNESFHIQTDDELTEKELKQIEDDDQAIQTIILGLPEDIYVAVDSCETTQEIWLRVQQMMKGSDIRIQEKKAKLFNEWERFTSNDGESIESYYLRFLKLMNDLKRNKHFSKKIASNLKFLNNLQPEWSRHVTIVHQIKDLHTANYTQLYDFLIYNQKEVDELKAERLAKTQDPLALMATSNNPYNFLNGLIGVPGNANHNLNGNGNLVAARAEGNAAGHNGNQIRCYNCRGTQILIAQKEEARILLQAKEFDLMAAAADLDEIEEVNANCILMANLQEALTSGTQTDKAPVYDSDGLAEVHDYENCYDNEIFNMFTQEEQYTELLEPIPESHQVPQNDNNVISKVTSMEQSGGTVEQHSENVKETRALYDSLYHNLSIKVEKVNTVNHLNKQLSKEKSIVSFLLEEKKKLKSDFKIREDELHDKQIQLEKRINELDNILVKIGQSIQMIHMLSPKPDSFYHTEQKMALGYQNPFYLKQAQKKKQSLYDGKVLHEKHDPPVVYDSEETLQLAQESRLKMKQLNKEIKPANYTKINHLSGVFVSQTAKSHEELYFSNNSKTAKVSKPILIPNEEFSDDTTPSVARKFLNEVKNTIVALQRVVKYRMTLETHNWSSSAHQELHKIVKDEIFPIVNQVDARVQNFEIQFLKEAAKFVRDFKSLAKEADEFLAKHKELELEIERLLKAVVSQDIMSVVQKNSVVDTSNLQTELERMKERFKNCIIKKENEYAKLWNDWYKKCEECKFDKISYDKAYNDMQQKIERLQAQLGDLKGKITSNSTSTPQESKVVKNDKTSRGKKQKTNVSMNKKKKKQKPKVKKTKKVRFIERLATPKSSKPRSFLRWSPTGRLFDLKVKIITSRKSESQFDCSKGDNTCTSNPLEPKIKRFPNSTFFWQVVQLCLWCVDSGCSKHMTGNLKLLINFVWKFLGTVRFGNDHVAAILGFGDLQWGNILITRVYFVEGLGYNLFSVGQFCASDLEVAFRRNACFVRNLEGKSKGASHPPKLVPNSRQRLHLLHMDLCGPMRIDIINGKRTDNGTEFKNQVLKEYFDSVGISHQVSSVRTPQQNGVVERKNQTLVEVARTMLIFSCAPLFLWAEAIATAKPDISFLHVFGALCYPKNDREDIGKLGAKAMAFEQRSSKPRLQSMTFGQINSGLDLTYAPSTITTQQPTEGELALLFEAMYDDYIGGQPSAAQRTVPDAQAQQVRQTSTTSTSIADTSPTPTNSSSQATIFPNTSQDVDGLSLQQQQAQQQGTQALLQPKTVAENVPNAMFDANTFVNPFATSSTSAAESSSSQNMDPSNMHTNQLRSDGDMCMYALTVSTMEPKNDKEAMTDPAWIKSMQEELLQFKRMDVWVLVPTPDNISPLTLKWIFKNKHDEEQTSNYVLEILNKYGMESCDPFGTLMEIKDKLDLDQNGTPVDATKYHSMIGALMYLTSSRPNIVHANCLCARYQAKPTKKHLKEDSGPELTGFSDVDYAGCKDTFKSTSGGTQFLGEKLLTNYGFHFKKIPIYCDSKSAIAISCNPVQHSRTKHIDVRYHFIKKHMKKGTIELYFVKTDYQLADIFTKALPADRFNYLVRRLGSDDGVTTPFQRSQESRPRAPSLYLDLGDCNQACEYCHAEFWYVKRLKEIIKELFKDRHFMESICAYNMMFSMTSFGDNAGDSVNNSSGPYVFKVEGKISHLMGSLYPPPGQLQCFCISMMEMQECRQNHQNL
nr:copia protein [Tanacetum cinerariifolium]